MSETPKLTPEQRAEAAILYERLRHHRHIERFIYSAVAIRAQLERDLAAANAENAKLRKHAEAMADAKHVYDWETHAAAYRADFPKETDHDK